MRDLNTRPKCPRDRRRPARRWGGGVIVAFIVGAIVGVIVGVVRPAGAQDAADEDRTIPFHGDTRLRLASQDEARAFLGTVDDWVRALGPFDRQLRLQSADPIDEERFLAFAGVQALEWDDASILAITSAAETVAEKLAALEIEPDLPAEILLIRSTGKEEGNAGGYTRGNAIVIPAMMSTRGVPAGFLLHELFHVMTRHDPGLREPLYAIIGFTACPPLEYPSTLVPRRITNPDAYHFDASIEITVGGEPVRAMPLTLARSLPYVGGGLFANVSIEFLVVEVEDGKTTGVFVDGEPVLHPLAAVEGYWEKIGRNTQYMIHPEEIMADNFAVAVLQRPGLPNPEILEAVLRVLKER